MIFTLTLIVPFMLWHWHTTPPQSVPYASIDPDTIYPDMMNQIQKMNQIHQRWYRLAEERREEERQLEHERQLEQQPVFMPN
tara:strand:+ start:533 stop:778 length:246 start_codon:yes stop_codon:yes gene_type:complete